MAGGGRALVDVISRILWGTAIAGALLGALDFSLMIGTASSAPQQAAGAAMSVGYAVLPYVLARDWDETTRPWPH